MNYPEELQFPKSTDEFREVVNKLIQRAEWLEREINLIESQVTPNPPTPGTPELPSIPDTGKEMSVFGVKDGELVNYDLVPKTDFIQNLINAGIPKDAILTIEDNKIKWIAESELGGEDDEQEPSEEIKTALGAVVLRDRRQNNQPQSPVLGRWFRREFSEIIPDQVDWIKLKDDSTICILPGAYLIISNLMVSQSSGCQTQIRVRYESSSSVYPGINTMDNMGTTANAMGISQITCHEPQVLEIQQKIEGFDHDAILGTVPRDDNPQPVYAQLAIIRLATIPFNASKVNRLVKKHGGIPIGDHAPIRVVQIPEGTFKMGSIDDKKWNEYPQHTVKIKSFFMGAYPVTNKQWNDVCELDPVNIPLSTVSGLEDEFVTEISPEEMEEFCNRISWHLKIPVRLPSEAEWEYACRDGTQTPYYTGKVIDPKFIPARNSRLLSASDFRPSFRFHLYAMVGFINQICADHWNWTYKDSPTDGSAWVYRKYTQDWTVRDHIGRGKFSTDESELRSGFRHQRWRLLYNERCPSTGFRIAIGEPNYTLIN